VATTGASLKIAAFAVGSAVGGVLTPLLGADRVILVVTCGQLVAAALGLVTSRAVRAPAPSDAPAPNAR
jgi:hypothetical protein